MQISVSIQTHHMKIERLKMKNKTAYIASRYRADTDEQFGKQLQLTKDISREVVAGGYDVIVPHLYYPLFLDDNNEAERKAGIASAIRLLDICDILLVCIGRGVSEGMEAEITHAKENDMQIRYFGNMNDLRDILKRLDVSQGN